MNNKERNRNMRSFPVACACLILSLLAADTWLPASCAAAEDEGDAGALRLGWASADITPDRPVVITGGSAARISEGVADHIYATALALESTGNNGTSEMVVMVSLDLVGVTDILYSRVQDLVRKATPEVAADKIILNATHTHTAPEILQERYDEKDYGEAMQPKDYVPVLYQRMAEAVVVTDPGGRIVDINDAYTRITGYDRAARRWTRRFRNCLCWKRRAETDWRTGPPDRMCRPASPSPTKAQPPKRHRRERTAP